MYGRIGQFAFRWTVHGLAALFPTHRRSSGGTADETKEVLVSTLADAPAREAEVPRRGHREADVRATVAAR